MFLFFSFFLNDVKVEKRALTNDVRSVDRIESETWRAAFLVFSSGNFFTT